MPADRFARRTLALVGLSSVLTMAVVPGLRAQLPEELPVPEEVAPQEAPPEPDEEVAEPDPDRIRFEGNLALEDGTKGRVSGSADSLEYDGVGRAVLSGDVRILYQDLEVRAERIELDEQTQDLVAEGNVIFDKGPQRVSGDLMEYNLDTELGRIVNAKGSMGTDYFFEGAEVLKTGAESFRVLQGKFTSCEGDVPAWSFRAKKIDVTVDGYAKVRGSTFRAKKVPLFYMPYLLWPVEDDRSTGFLLPQPGYSERRGVSLGLAYFWAMNRSFDSTFFLDLFAGGNPQNLTGDPEYKPSGEFLGAGYELRYRPSEHSLGALEGYAIRDPEFDKLRWRFRYDHESAGLPAGLRAVVHLEDASDFQYFQDYERRGDRNSLRQLYSNGFLTGNWRAHSLYVNLDQRETYFNVNNIVTLRQLPEVEYKLRSTKLGRTPLYLQMRSGAYWLYQDRGDLLETDYGRADIFPEVTLPIRTVPWLSLSLTAGARATWYGDSLLTAEEKAENPDRDSDFSGRSLTRVLPSARAEIVGPSFSRIFGNEGSARYKHVIEPRVNYNFLDDYDEQALVPRFDELDPIIGSDVVTYALINRLLTKPAGETGGSAFEVLNLELSQAYSVDQSRPIQSSIDGTKTSQTGPVRVRLRYQPSRRANLQVESRYDTLFSSISLTSISGTFNVSQRTRVGLRYTNRQQPETGRTLTDQLRLSLSVPVWKRVSFEGQANLDFDPAPDGASVLMQRYLIRYRGSCYDMLFEFGDYNFGVRKDREFRFSLNLKNVGSFLDIRGGTSEQL